MKTHRTEYLQAKIFRNYAHNIFLLRCVNPRIDLFYFNSTMDRFLDILVAGIRISREFFYVVFIFS